jgi:tRNA wybutosine-synthesizing protein 2
MPNGYQRLGRVLIVRLPAGLARWGPTIGDAWRAELGVATVLARVGPVAGELRQPTVERLAGDDSETEVVEHGIRWRFDAARILFAAGNRTERHRAGLLTRRGERVVDLFAGIGYFAIPAARLGGAARVLAVDKNPLAIRYLAENAALNGVADRVTAVLGDNRDVELPPHGADRVFLGYLPSAVPWVPRALALVRAGGWLHVHAVADARGGTAAAGAEVRRAIEAAGAALDGVPGAREVKPYGPGRMHVVVDARIGRLP